jgi:hypothetical protein
MKKFNIENLGHYGDILAIPFFLLTFLYFYNLEEKTPFEILLMLFALSGFILDILFVFLAFFVYK